ncbi:acyl-CoA dehydrogenase [Carbonactinospora thermoautotrophica]|uniref:Acyl-CoA dehydrogenase n=1 Tax=Carbonactinospora thermoautotrophica TaxID=1469144 RepID=A0A132MT18_9ACTN|nr:acyl-CoA dehydrogenase family protein [Carbonactinospora thermoautotrophica]KWW97667.1 acyl-CoA dehydrogenase [Carbonactinospora thermoautotrophica]KWX00886.1 Acyl-CoA dehydrogenase [Carbonactinospora thermoautotrophica]KWX08670.1 acyl-CoA dehydrogenase [Carbonactinospora thermoautotrophica]
MGTESGSAPRGGRRVLTEELLDRFASRVADYDRDNVFFVEDFEELQQIGYLKIAVPEEFGGLGFSLPEVAREQRRLAYRSPATALAVNMHIYWTGAAADVYRSGDESLTWLLKEAAAGEVFAAGHGEPGNDLVLAHSNTRAEPVQGGGYRFYGRKIFTSLSPVWTWLGVHGLDDSDPANPKVVHAFIRRDAPGYRIIETWDTLGMRPTRSDDTLLEGVVAEPEHVARVLPAGPPTDAFLGSVFAWVLPLFGNIYYAIARRAFDLAVESAKQRRSKELGGRTFAHHPFTQWTVAEAALQLEAIEAQLDQVVDDWAAGVDHGERWTSKLFAAKYNAVEGAKRVVDLALRVAGGAALFKTNELERLYRDVRAGAFHPPGANLVHDLVGKTALGVLGE